MPHATLLAALCLALAALAAAPGCGGGPKVSGFGIGHSRVLSVGDEVELKLPVSSDGMREWRVSSYDSYYFTVIGRPRLLRSEEGEPSILVNVRALNAGETTVEITEQLSPQEIAQGKKPRKETFTFHISQ